eukprot:Nk52_evm87s224 gene=Nk52_evmTU87s224
MIGSISSKSMSAARLIGCSGLMTRTGYKTGSINRVGEMVKSRGLPQLFLPGAVRQVCGTSACSFDNPEGVKRFSEVFQEDPLCQVTDVRGKMLLGNVLGFKQDFVYVDVGLKYPAVAPVAPGIRPAVLRPGMTVMVQMRDIELTKTLLGQSRPSGGGEAEVELVHIYES